MYCKIYNSPLNLYNNRSHLSVHYSSTSISHTTQRRRVRLVSWAVRTCLLLILQVGILCEHLMQIPEDKANSPSFFMQRFNGSHQPAAANISRDCSGGELTATSNEGIAVNRTSWVTAWEGVAGNLQAAGLAAAGYPTT